MSESIPPNNSDELKRQKEIETLQKEIAELRAARVEAEQRQIEAKKLIKVAQAQTEQLISEANQKQVEAEKLLTATQAQTEQLISEANQKQAEAEKLLTATDAQTTQLIAEAKQKTAEAEKLLTATDAQTTQLIAEAKQKTAEAERATLLAKFPKGETKGLEGTIAVNDKFGYIAETASYEAISRILNDIVAKIKRDIPKTNNVRILLVNDQNFASGDIVKLQLQKTIEVMKRLLQEQKIKNDRSKDESKEIANRGELGTTGGLETAVPIVLTSLISTAADLAGYFQSNFEIKGQDFEPAREAVIHQLVDQIKDLNPIILNFYMLENSSIIDSFSEILDLKQELINSQLELDVLGINPLTARISRDSENIQRYKEDLKKTPGDIELSQQIDTMERELKERNKILEEAKAIISKTVTLTDAFDKFVESITKPANSTDLPLLAQAALRQFIIDKGVTHLLWIKPVSSGGEAIAKKQLFRSGHVSYIGGCVISYVLAEKDGTIISSGTTQALSQISHVLSTNRNYRLKHVQIVPAERNWIEKIFDSLNM